MEQCAIAFPGTIAFCLRMVWRTALLFFLPLSCVFGYIRDLLLERSRLLGLARRPSRSCLSRGNLCHAGGWHLRRKPRVELFFVPFSIVVLFRFAHWCFAALN